MFQASLSLLLLFLSSCSLFLSDKIRDENQDNNQEQQETLPEDMESSSETPSPELIKEVVSAIEIEWRAPKTKVLRYILRYGKSPDDLDSEEEIELKDLKEITHPVHGKLYKYLLVGFPSKSVVYYSLQAENEFGLSEPTPVAKEEVR